MKNFKILKILKSKRGASLILVLCVMVLLMGISGSVLFAASTAAGGGVERQNYDRLTAFSDSIIRTVTFSLCRQGEDEDGHLGRELFYDLGNFHNESYNENIKDARYPSEQINPSGVTYLEINYEDIPAEFKLESLEMRFPEQSVDITPYEPAIKEEQDTEGTIISPAIPRKPQKVQVAFDMTLTLNAIYKGEKLTSVAKYTFSGGSLEDSGNEEDEKKLLNIKNDGKWEMISYERVES